MKSPNPNLCGGEWRVSERSTGSFLGFTYYPLHLVSSCLNSKRRWTGQVPCELDGVRQTTFRDALVLDLLVSILHGIRLNMNPSHSENGFAFLVIAQSVMKKHVKNTLVRNLPFA